MSDLLQQGMTAYHAGRRDEARKLWIAAAKQNPTSEQAWSWLYLVTENDRERLDCLQQILRIDPQNEKAQQLLDQLKNPAEPPVSSTAGDTPKKPREDEKAILMRQQIVVLAGIVLFVPAILVSASIFHSERYALLVAAGMQMVIGLSAIKNRVLFVKMRGKKYYIRDDQAVLDGRLLILIGLALTVYAFIPLLQDLFLSLVNYPPAGSAPDGFTIAFILSQNAWSAYLDHRVLQAGAVVILAAGLAVMVWSRKSAARKRPLPAWATEQALVGVVMGLVGLVMIEASQGPLLRDCADLQNQYDSHAYTITEGVVHVHHAQPLGGHAQGDLITLGDGGDQFEVDYFTTTCAYKKTIAWGGILTENAYARIYSNSRGAILRIDLRNP